MGYPERGIKKRRQNQAKGRRTMAEILDGKALAAKIHEEQAEQEFYSQPA